MKLRRSKRIIESCKKWYINASLYRKIIILVVIILGTNLVTNLISLGFVTISNNKLLYEAISSTLTTGTNIISTKLLNIEKMTDVMVSDSRIQNNLVASAESASNNIKNEAYLTMSFLIPEYFNNYKSYNIKFINLYTENYTTYSNATQSAKIPDHINESCIQMAQEQSGYPIWIDQYADGYGLFLSRDVRKAKNLELSRLGTILVNVDIEKLIATSINTDMLSEPAEYILLNKERIIYYSDNLDVKSTAELNATIKDNKTGVIRLNDKQYFYVRTGIPKTEWDMICVVSYQRIFLTQLYTKLGALAINAVALVIVFLIARLFINSITKHLSSLVKKMQTFAKSQIFVPENHYDYSNRKDEIGELHVNFDKMAVEHQELVNKYFYQEILMRETKLKALENQINPHFLYNTLESINWRAKSLGDKEISSMIESLGALFRVALSNMTNNVTSTLAQEIKVVNYYMDIIQIRFRERVDYRLDIDDRLLNCVLPTMTLQPLVENAVNYAMEESVDGCLLVIKVFEEADKILIQIINSGSQFDKLLLYKLENKLIEPRGSGIGILNIQQRIQLLFGDDYGLYFYNLDDEHAVAQISVPRQGVDHDKITYS